MVQAYPVRYVATPRAHTAGRRGSQHNLGVGSGISGHCKGYLDTARVHTAGIWRNRIRGRCDPGITCRIFDTVRNIWSPLRAPKAGIWKRRTRGRRDRGFSCGISGHCKGTYSWELEAVNKKKVQIRPILRYIWAL